MHFSLKRKQYSKKVFKSIENNLLKVSNEIAIDYLSWLEKKTQYLNESFTKVGYKNQPDNLSRGDIIWVEFGINVGNELSDFKTKGHYAVCWMVSLGNVVVIPLTSHETIGNEFSIPLGIIEGLDEKENTISYLKLDAIRSISKRRIGRMNNKKYGKIHLSDDKINIIRKALINAFIL